MIRHPEIKPSPNGARAGARSRQSKQATFRRGCQGLPGHKDGEDAHRQPEQEPGAASRSVRRDRQLKPVRRRIGDFGAAIAGALGLAPSASLNPERKYASLFEPVHGSAPDIFGKGIANPIAQAWAGAMMLDHLGQAGAAKENVSAIAKLLAARDAPKTPDLGGNAKTQDVAKALVEQFI